MSALYSNIRFCLYIKVVPPCTRFDCICIFCTDFKFSRVSKFHGQLYWHLRKRNRHKVRLMANILLLHRYQNTIVLQILVETFVLWLPKYWILSPYRKRNLIMKGGPIIGPNIQIRLNYTKWSNLMTG